MKKLGTTNFTCIYSMDVLCVNGMAQVKGGASNKDEGEWEVNYIDGKPYLVRKTSTGEVLEIKPLF